MNQSFQNIFLVGLGVQSGKSGRFVSGNWVFHNELMNFASSLLKETWRDPSRQLKIVGGTSNADYISLMGLLPPLKTFSNEGKSKFCSTTSLYVILFKWKLSLPSINIAKSELSSSLSGVIHKSVFLERMMIEFRY